LGVECDGATYHSSATARDRDRLRQDVLAGLGWHLCRIWSTDWLKNREPHIRRVLAAVECARRQPPSLRRRRTPSSAIPTPPMAAKPSEQVTTSPTYDSIGDVPEAMIHRAVTEVLVKSGSTGTEDLSRSVSRKLGFKRNGKVIDKRIKDVIDSMLNAGQLEAASDDGRVQVKTRTDPPLPSLGSVRSQ
jgi:hypothetical protein